MDWSRFDAHGENKSAAFEAFSGQLFERWCRKVHGAALGEVRFVRGDGGDGGVEAYALLASDDGGERTDRAAGGVPVEAYTRLASGDCIGLQAKWFEGGLGKEQIRQIERSLRTAIGTRPRLIRYCVALRQNLTDARGRAEETERQRWDEFLLKARSIAPGTAIELWDERRLEGLLAEPGNEGLHAYWFPGSVAVLHDLKRRFEAQQGGWLGGRYVPDLHAAGKLEEDLSIRLGSPEARSHHLRRALAVAAELQAVHRDVTRLAGYPTFMRSPEASELRDQALRALDRIIRAAEADAQAVRAGAEQAAGASVQDDDLQAVRRLEVALAQLDRSARPSHAPTRKIYQRVKKCLHGEKAALLDLCARKHWWERLSRVAAYLGPPGAGKTHGLAHAVHARLEAGLPALLLRAKDCPVSDGWEAILGKALDRPRTPLVELLNALEAAAVRADVRRAEPEPASATEIALEPTRVLLAIDGLEESGAHHRHRWAELLGELPVHLASHPRFRVAVTLRTASGEAILGRVHRRRDVVHEVRLPEGGEVQKLLPQYCRYYRIDLPDRRLRWAIRDPLSLRLYCELQADSQEPPADRQDVSISGLLRKKLDHVEEDLRLGGGWSDRDTPLHVLLELIAIETVQRGSALERDEVLELASRQMPRLPPPTWSWILDQCEERGLLLMHADEPEDPLGRKIQVVEPAFDPLTDFLIARQVCEQLGAPGAARKLPAHLRSRPDALTQAAVLLAQEKGISLVRSGLWAEDLSTEELERLELRAIAALNSDAARTYEDWVLDRLRSSMPSCRRVLKELCIPVARDDEHPFGPRFIHEALRPLQPAKRDLFWSGPRYLHGEAGQPWTGEGDQALELLDLESDDAAAGPPLLLAWALTSVDSRWRRGVRATLARWGAGQLDELQRWLDLAFQTNDPQMAEDVAMVAFGAACLAGNDVRLANLARWATENLLALDAPHRREDLAVLHAARGIVERARVVGVPVDASAAERAQSFYRTGGGTLPFDADAARAASDHDGVRPITGDLAWYVVPAAIEGFFEPVNHRGRESPDSALSLATDELLSAAMAGTLGPLREDVRRAFEEELERRRTQEQTLTFVLDLATDQHAARRSEAATAEGAKPITDTRDREEDSLPDEHLGSSVELGAAGGLDSRAGALLAEYARLAQVETLTPQRFAFGVLKAHLQEMGRSEDEPSEEGPSYRASMDGAIMWAHRPATHGGRSPICTLAEKYVWTGCRILGAHLAGRIPFFFESWDGVWVEPPVDPVLIASMEPNPASDVPGEDEHLAAAAWSFWPDDALVVKLPSLARAQVARAIEWVRAAPLPDICPWLLLPRHASPPHIAGMEHDDWLTLRCLVSAREDDAQGDAQIRIWAAGMNESDAALLARDLKLGIRALLDRLVELPEETVRQAGFVDPSETLWAPWLTHVSCGRSVVTIDDQGALKPVDIVTATAEADWVSSTGGKEIWVPAHWIRRAMGLTDARPAHGGAEWHFVDREGVIHALYTSRSTDGEIRRALIVRRRSLEAAMRSCGLTLLWLGQLHRQPSAELRGSLSEEERDLHGVWCWLARMSDAGPAVIHESGSAFFSSNKPEPQIPRATQERAAIASLVPVGPVNPDLAVPLSTELTDDAIPYFLWDDPMPVSELRRRLAIAPPHERAQLLGKILREARDPDVWHFTTPGEVAARFGTLARHLGRRRRFWEFLLNRWHMEGLLEQKPA